MPTWKDNYLSAQERPEVLRAPFDEDHADGDDENDGELQQSWKKAAAWKNRTEKRANTKKTADIKLDRRGAGN